MLCRLRQWKISRTLDSERPLTDPRLHAHLSRCPRCRAFYENARAAEDLLRCQSPVSLTADSVWHLQRNIVALLDRPAEIHTPLSGDRHFYPRAAAAIVLLTAGLLTFYLARTGGDLPRPPQEAAGFFEHAAALQIPLPVLAAWTEEPVHRELMRLTDDLRNAVTFLINCAPDAFADFPALADSALSPAERTH